MLINIVESQQLKVLIQIIFISAFLISCSLNGPHQSDETMIQNFQSKQKQFERLISMVQNDIELRRVDDNWTDPSDPSTIGISPSRIADYRKLFSECGITRGFDGYHKEKEIIFIVSSFGLATGGSSKGYAFKIHPPPPEELVRSIDDYKPNNGRSYWIYRPIISNWYLYYEYDD